MTGHQEFKVRRCFGCGLPYQSDVKSWMQQVWVNVGSGSRRKKWMCPRCAKRGR